MVCVSQNSIYVYRVGQFLLSNEQKTVKQENAIYVVKCFFVKSASYVTLSLEV